MFCAPRLFLGGTEGAGSSFHVLRSQTLFERGLIIMFCARGIVFGGPRASCPVFKFYAPGLVLGGTLGVRSNFHVLRSRTRLEKYRGPRVPFTCFVLPDSFSTVTGVFGPIFIFYAPGLVLGGTEGVRVPF
jgi:hypothetical protein